MPWPKGRKRTEDEKERISKGTSKSIRKKYEEDPTYAKRVSQGLIGHYVSDETRQKQSKAKLGKASLLKGKIRSEEFNKKVSIGIIKKWRDPEFKRKQRESRLGKKQSEETKRKRSETLREGYYSGRIKHPQKGKRQTKEFIEKLKISVKNAYDDPIIGKEIREKNSRSLKKNSEKRSKNISIALRKNGRMSEVSKKMWQDPEYRKKQLETRRLGGEWRRKKSESQKGKPIKLESRKKLSITLKEKNKRGELDYFTKYWKGKNQSEESCKRRSITLKKAYDSGKRSREHQSYISKKNWENPEYAKRVLSGWLDRGRVSSLEIKVFDLLEFVFPGRFLHNKKGKELRVFFSKKPKNLNDKFKDKKYKVPDIVTYDKIKVIEVNGSSLFIHGNDTKEDLRCLKRLYRMNGGHICEFIWDYELKNSKKLIRKIEKFLSL